MKLTHLFSSTLILSALCSSAAYADQVILDDLIINGGSENSSACIGGDCIDGEEFDFDTLRLKAADPQIHFQDTSSSASFPTNDWRMGIRSDSDLDSAYFYIENTNDLSNALVLETGAGGGVALGNDATLESGAISVGSTGDERRIMHVATGTNDNDAINKAQLDTALSSLQSDHDAKVSDINSRLDAIIQRLDQL